MSNRSAVRQGERARHKRHIREARLKAELAAWKTERRRRRLSYILFWRRGKGKATKPQIHRPKTSKPKADTHRLNTTIGILRLVAPGALGIAIVIYRSELGPRVAWIMLFMAVWCGGVSIWKIRASAWNKFWLYGTFAAAYAAVAGFLLAH